MPKRFLLLALLLPLLLYSTPGAAQSAAPGLVYSTDGRHYIVDLELQRSVRIGPAPPRGSRVGPDSAFVRIDLRDFDPRTFAITSFPADPNALPEMLFSGQAFYAQFPDHVAPLTYQQDDARLASVVVSSDKTRLFFVACRQGMGEGALCEPFQFDFASQQTSLLPGMIFNDTRVWMHPDGRQAVDSWDIACAGSFVPAGRDPVQLSGLPTGVAWLADQRFVYSRYVCSGVFFPDPTFEQRYDLVLADANGQNEQVLVPGMLAREMAISPDQQQLAFITSDPGNLGRDRDALWVVNLDGSGLQRIMDVPTDTTDLRWDAPLNPGLLRAPEPPPLPTIGEIAFLHEGNLLLFDLASGQTKTLIDDVTVGTPGVYGGIQVAWSPDGLQLAYASNRSGNYDIYLRDLANGSEIAITNDPADEFLPTFAPDGTLLFARIIERSELDNTTTWALVRYTSTGELRADPPQTSSDPIRLQALDAAQVASITFHRVSGNLDTGRPDVTWDHGHYGCPTPVGPSSIFDASWSPDRNILAVIGADCWSSDSYSWNYPWNNALFLVDAANPQRAPERLSLDYNWFTSLAWSPDGAWLVVAHDTDPVFSGSGRSPNGLWLINLEAGDPQRITTIGQHPAWRPLTPAQIAALAPTATPNPPTPEPTATPPEAPTATPRLNPTADTATGGANPNTTAPATPANSTNSWIQPLMLGGGLLMLSIALGVGLVIFLRRVSR